MCDLCGLFGYFHLELLNFRLERFFLQLSASLPVSMLPPLLYETWLARHAFACHQSQMSEREMFRGRGTISWFENASLPATDGAIQFLHIWAVQPER